MWLTACVVLKAALGVGVLSLPGAFARLGWIPAGLVLASLAAIVVYSGLLYTRLTTQPYRRTDQHGGHGHHYDGRQHGAGGGGGWTGSRCRHPVMLHSLARMALGRAGEVGAFLTAYATIWLLPAIFHITAVEALSQVLGPPDSPPLLLHGLLVLGAVVALAQLQSLTQAGAINTRRVAHTPLGGPQKDK
ncbi:hypothetical protein VOLCADRAFT_93559 [Volvox carteri f. nagariensis]|uniref:Amino acid transporter transmembrane domain-containing protein n=1 Tax=Volvox carteri f. nagariensis TaxID=3068 RepID=D8U2F8_VOLCA|nr:uncharacterized protein VOLCADRAFT_93559 [Volvox carteri f. nagariensis]EFJ46056.1 hypothetical protein VOLCADRAFT_93559 [Volvox carteri f. nagariensis]|eukprot:XP_002952806.1 hypothetical protein VOLCADRAFT_93559 [Volvox carteri f. nagariensis]